MLTMLFSDRALTIEGEVRAKSQHRRHAVQLSVGLKGAIWASLGAHAAERPMAGVLIGPNQVHCVRGSVVNVFSDPQSSLGSTLRAALGRSPYLELEPAWTVEVARVASEAMLTRDFRIRRNNVGPMRRNRAKLPIIALQQQALAVAVVPLADADELPPAERVKRVRDAHKTCRSNSTDCISS